MKRVTSKSNKNWRKLPSRHERQFTPVREIRGQPDIHFHIETAASLAGSTAMNRVLLFIQQFSIRAGLH